MLLGDDARWCWQAQVAYMHMVREYEWPQRTYMQMTFKGPQKWTPTWHVSCHQTLPKWVQHYIQRTLSWPPHDSQNNDPRKTTNEYPARDPKMTYKWFPNDAKMSANNTHNTLPNGPQNDPQRIHKWRLNDLHMAPTGLTRDTQCTLKWLPSLQNFFPKLWKCMPMTSR